MKLIPLTQGQFAKVDDADYDELSKHKWCAHWHHRRSLFYAVRSSRTPNGKIRTIMMHRQVLGLIDRKTHGDHKNHNTLDNQRENIRAVTNSQNHMNRNGATRNSKTGVRGVGNNGYGYQARITVNGRGLYLGTFPTAELASVAYAAANKLYFGEYGGVQC